MLNVIGKLYDISDTESPVSIERAGWHANSTERLNGLDDYRVYPYGDIEVDGEIVTKTPKYRFAGIPAEDTFYYSFPDKATADELLAPFLPVEE